MGPIHLSWLQLREAKGSLDDALLDVHLFQVDAVDDQFIDIATYLMMGCMPDDFNIA